MSTSSDDAQSMTASRLFDLRMIIAILFWIYGVVLTIMGLSTTEQDLERAGGVDLNLWGGISMLILAALFTLWVWLRPLKLPTPEEQAAAAADGPPAH
jgi:xanthine/uracil/vitamin C permease (AzgA family)